MNSLKKKAEKRKMVRPGRGSFRHLPRLSVALPMFPWGILGVLWTPAFFITIECQEETHIQSLQLSVRSRLLHTVCTHRLSPRQPPPDVQSWSGRSLPCSSPAAANILGCVSRARGSLSLEAELCWLTEHTRVPSSAWLNCCPECLGHSCLSLGHSCLFP